MRRILPIFTIVVVLLLATTTTAFAKPDEWAIICNHVVRTGETIYSIARAYGVSPNAIAAQNGIVCPNRIGVGTVLAIPNVPARLPAGPVAVRQCVAPVPTCCTCVARHTVTAGENLFRISLAAHVSMWRVAECNNITNLNFVRAGMVLCIPAS
jgi:peptidoglycan-N-acetylglucosamine deacetylase